jgi:hypothetical protein
MPILGGRIPWAGAPSWERDRDGSLKSAAHDGTADGEFRHQYSTHRSRYDIQVWVCAPTTLATAGKASAHNLGALNNNLAYISAPCHSTELDVEPKWLRDTSTWSSLSLRSFAPDSSAKPLAAWEVFSKWIEKVPGKISVSAELTEHFEKSSTSSQARAAGARRLAGTMHDYATIVEPADTMRAAALLVNIGALVGAFSGLTQGRESRAECDCCGAMVSSGWRIGRSANKFTPPCPKPNRKSNLGNQMSAGRRICANTLGVLAGLLPMDPEER